MSIPAAQMYPFKAIHHALDVLPEKGSADHSAALEGLREIEMRQNAYFNEELLALARSPKAVAFCLEFIEAGESTALRAPG